MRLSVDPEDSGFDSTRNVSKVKVLLDGQLLKWCITADEERGLAVVYKTDSKGAFIFDDANDSIEKQTLRGKVVIRCPWAWRCDPQNETLTR